MDQRCFNKHLNELNAQILSEKTKGYKIPDDIRTIDIDTQDDFSFAEFLLEKGYV